MLTDKIEAKDFYSEQVDKLTKDFLDEKETSQKHPVGIVFITFDTINNAKEVFDSFQRSMLQCNYEASWYTFGPSSFLLP